MLQWRIGANIPNHMNYYPEAVVINRSQVYVGAGSTHDFREREVVMVYDIEKDRWSKLPPYDCYWFGMTSTNGDRHLVLVGGVDIQSDADFRTNKLGMWDKERNKWVYPYPPMPTARSGPTVATFSDRWLIAAGGYNEITGPLTTVEILDVLSCRWYSASPLPINQFKMSSAIVGNMLYLLGGHAYGLGQQVLCVCLDDLIYQALYQVTTPSSLWKKLPDTPATKSTALSLDGHLLAVGGVYSMAIHFYQPSSKSWVKIWDLTSNKQECACAVLPSGEVFIAGGDANLAILSSVDIGSFAH